MLTETKYEILNYIRQNPGADRKSIISDLNLSYPTTSGYLKELLDEGLIKNEDETGFSVNADKFLLVGISIGASECKICFVNTAFRMVDAGFFEVLKSVEGAFEKNEKFKFIDSGSDNYLCFNTPKDFISLKQLIDYLLLSIEQINDRLNEGWLKGTEGIKRIGISFTGNVRGTKVVSSVNLPYLNDLDIEEILIDQKHIQYFKEHDIVLCYKNNSEASSIAEYQSLFWQTYEYNGEIVNNPLHHYKNYKNIAALYFGAGTGLGLIINHKVQPYRDIGHMQVPDLFKQDHANDSNLDKVCRCGGSNCFDHRVRTDVFKMNFEQYCDLTSDQLAELLKNDTCALNFSRYLAYLISVIQIMFGNPDLLIILGGKLYKSVEEIRPYLYSELVAYKTTVTIGECRYESSILGPVSAAVGAAIGITSTSDISLVKNQL